MMRARRARRFARRMHPARHRRRADVACAARRRASRGRSCWSAPDALVGTIGGGALEYMVIDARAAGAARRAQPEARSTSRSGPRSGSAAAGGSRCRCGVLTPARPTSWSARLRARRGGAAACLSVRRRPCRPGAGAGAGAAAAAGARDRYAAGRTARPARRRRRARACRCRRRWCARRRRAAPSSS